MPIFLPGEPEFDETEAAHGWVEAVLLAEYGEQENVPNHAEPPDSLNWLRLIPVSRQFDLETVECSMVYHAPGGDYACSIWDATGEADDPWAVLLVDTFGPRLLHEYCLWDEDTGEAERDAVLRRAQNEIPDRAEAGEWVRGGPPLVVPDYLQAPRPKETE